LIMFLIWSKPMIGLVVVVVVCVCVCMRVLHLSM